MEKLYTLKFKNGSIWPGAGVFGKLEWVSRVLDRYERRVAQEYEVYVDNNTPDDSQVQEANRLLRSSGFPSGISASSRPVLPFGTWRNSVGLPEMEIVSLYAEDDRFDIFAKIAPVNVHGLV